jgi:hypothetical protein
MLAIDPLSRLLQLRFFATRNEDLGTILHEAGSRHFAESSCAASDKYNMVGEAKKR